jgi:hypothetical protein
MTDHKATPEQWAQVEAWMAIESEYSACVLELRDRIEALEDANYARRIDIIRLANAVANQVPDRTKFFADVMPDGDDND